jgi:hypothetical protein
MPWRYSRLFVFILLLALSIWTFLAMPQLSIESHSGYRETTWLEANKLSNHTCIMNISDKLLNLGRAAFIIDQPLTSNVLAADKDQLICAYVVINDTAYKSVPAFSPDTFVVNAIGRKFAYPMPQSDILPFKSYVISRQSVVRIYTVPIRILDADLFDIRVVLEGVGYSWARNEPPTNLRMPHYRSTPDGPVFMEKPLQIKIRGSPITPAEYMKLPFCTRADHPGRWVAASHFANVNDGWSVNRSAFALKPEHALRFLPLGCRYKQYDYNKFKSVLNRFPLAHFYGLELARHFLQFTFDGAAQSCEGAICKPDGFKEYLTSPKGSSTLLYMYTVKHMNYWEFDKREVLERLTKYQRSALPSHTGFEQGNLLISPDIVLICFGDYNRFGDYDKFVREAEYFADRIKWSFPHSLVVWKPKGFTSNTNRMQSRRFDLALGKILGTVGVRIWDSYGMQQGLPREWGGNLEHEENIALMNLIANYRREI